MKHIRSKVGPVFQNPDDQLFSPTVFDDVAFGLLNQGRPETDIRQAVQRALELVGMAGFELRSPHHLSLGEKKRIAIATVLAQEPDVLVIDEPTGSLDPRGKYNLMALLKRLPVTKIIASHDLDLVREVCPRVVILDGGKIAADGSTVAILADRPLLAAHGLCAV